MEQKELGRVEFHNVQPNLQASGYLGAVAVVLYPDNLTQQQQWLELSCHQLKHDPGSASQLYNQMLKCSQSQSFSKAIQENLAAAVTYFHNHHHQMNYAD